MKKTIFDPFAILKQAAFMTWQYKSLWFFGFLATLTGHAGIIAFHFLPAPNTSTRQSVDLLEQYEQFVTSLNAGNGWTTVIALSLLFISVVAFLWLSNLLAEGALIQSVVRYQQNQPITLLQGWRDGTQLVGRYVKLDTLLFLPLFILTLLIALVFFVVIGVGIFQIMESKEMNTIMTTIGLGLVCLVPLAFLYLPLMPLTTITRLFSFRTLVLGNHQARESLKVMWRICRQNIAYVVVMIAFLWGTRIVLRLVLVSIMIPFSSFAVFPLLPALSQGDWSVLVQATEKSVWQTLWSLIGNLLQIVVQSGIHVFLSVGWTLAYQTLLANKKNE